MRLISATYHNFFCFIDQTMHFDRPGLTTIEGEMQNAVGADSNGSGKSAIFDGVAWCWYGRCLREKYKGDDIVRIGTPDRQRGTWVETVLEDDSGQEIRIVRYRQHPREKNNVRVFIGGVDATAGTNPETDDRICRLFGMDFKAFSNSVAFGTREDIKSFFSAADGDRKAILDRLLGLSVYAEAEKLARRRLRTLTSDLDAADKQLVRLQERLDQKQHMLVRSPDPEKLAQDELNVRVQKAFICMLARLRAGAESRLACAQADLDAAEAEHAEVLASWKAACAENEQHRSAIRRELQTLEREAGKCDGEVASLQRRVLRFYDMDGTECPTCLQKVSKKHTEGFVRELQDQIRDASSKAAKIRTKIAEEQKILSGIIDADRPEILDVDTFSQEVAIEGGEFDAYTAQWEEAKRDLRELEASYARDSAASDSAKAEFDAVSEELRNHESSTRDLRANAARLEFWIQAFGNAGLKSYLIEAEIPEINRRATGYAQPLLGPGSFVQLSATKQLKSRDASKEELTIKAEIPGCTKTFAGASKGQKRKLDLSLLLAFRDLVAARSIKPFNLLFADELFDGLDRTGCAVVVEMLQETAKECPVFLVTHSEYIKSAGNQMVRVVHDGESAQIFSGDSGINSDRKKTEGGRRGRRSR